MTFLLSKRRFSTLSRSPSNSCSEFVLASELLDSSGRAFRHPCDSEKGGLLVSGKDFRGSQAYFSRRVLKASSRRSSLTKISYVLKARLSPVDRVILGGSGLALEPRS